MAGLALSLLLCGCSERERAEAGDRAEQATERAGRALDKAGDTLSDSGTTMKVKSALSLSSKLISTGINVDTMDKMVHLRGTVPSADQSALAERIAKDTVGPDVRVVNELKVDANMNKDSAKNPPGPAKR
jgi:osmotically-inducible protein OsmY